MSDSAWIQRIAPVRGEYGNWTERKRWLTAFDKRAVRFKVSGFFLREDEERPPPCLSERNAPVGERPNPIG